MKRMLWPLLLLISLGVAYNQGLDSPAFVASLNPVVAGGVSCDTLRNSYTNTITGVLNFGNATPGFAHHFYASNTYSVCKAKLFLGVIPTVSFNLSCSIWFTTNSGGNGGPQGLLGGYSTEIDGSTLSGTNWVEFEFSTPAPLVNGSNYYVAVLCDGYLSGEIMNWQRSSASITNSYWQSTSDTNWTYTGDNRMPNYQLFSE